MMKLHLVCFSGLLILAALPALAQTNSHAIYHWQDDNGVSHYSRQPPMDRLAERVNTATGMSQSERQEIQRQLMDAPDQLPATAAGDSTTLCQGLEADKNNYYLGRIEDNYRTAKQACDILYVDANDQTAHSHCYQAASEQYQMRKKSYIPVQFCR